MFVVVLGTHGNPPSECSYSILFLKNPQEKTGKILEVLKNSDALTLTSILRIIKPIETKWRQIMKAKKFSQAHWQRFF